MRTLFFRCVGLCAVAALSLFLCTSVQAAYTVTFSQDGNNVVATGSGTINLDGLGLIQTSSPFPGAYVIPSAVTEVTGPAAPTLADIYAGVNSGAPSWGPGGMTIADSGSGDLVGIDATIGAIAVPAGYTSGGALSDTSTYDNTTLAAMGLDVGTYVYSWTAAPLVTAGNASPDVPPVTDTFTVVVSSSSAGSSVPLAPSAWSGLLALAGMGALTLKRHPPRIA